jgi:hypothetical protein
LKSWKSHSFEGFALDAGWCMSNLLARSVYSAPPSDVLV